MTPGRGADCACRPREGDPEPSNLGARPGRSHSLSHLVEIAAEEVLSALGVASTTVSRIEGHTTLGTIINVGDLGPEEDRWPPDEVYAIRGIGSITQVVDHQVTWTAHLGELDGDPFELELLRTLGKGAALGAPILVDGEMWGELYATRYIDEVPFRAEDVSYVQVLVAILGGAVSRCLREESLTELAHHDSLTGLLNRRGLDFVTVEAFDVPAGTSRSVTAVIFDINGLKRVNDSLGHAVGDQFIQSVAQELNTIFSGVPGSHVARVGGTSSAFWSAASTRQRLSGWLTVSVRAPGSSSPARASPPAPPASYSPTSPTSPEFD